MPRTPINPEPSKSRDAGSGVLRVTPPGCNVISAEVIPRFLPLLSSNQALMAAWSVPVGKALSVMVQTNVSGVELPTSLKAP